jgi:hypothetical protein
VFLGDLDEAIKDWQPPRAQSEVALQVGEHVPEDIRQEFTDFIRERGGGSAKGLIERCKAYADGQSVLSEANRFGSSRYTYWPGSELAKELDAAIKSWQPPHAPRGGSNWYFAEDRTRCLRQVVLTSDPRLAASSRYHALALSYSFIDLIRQPLNTGLLKLDGDPLTFLLVRTDGIVEEVAKSVLHVAFSFCHLPTSGLVAIYVSCGPLKERTKFGFLEQIYGLDGELIRNLIANAVKGESLHIVHAGGGGLSPEIADTGEKMVGPKCEYDVTIPYADECRLVLEKEWNAVLAHHRSIRRPDFQAAGQCLYELMPVDSNPILPRFPFQQFEHAMIFVKGPARNFELSDEVHKVLEEMTGETIREVSLKARPIHVVGNSGGVVDNVAKGMREGLVAAAELAVKLRDENVGLRFIDGSLTGVERYFHDPESGLELAIILFYGVQK